MQDAFILVSTLRDPCQEIAALGGDPEALADEAALLDFGRGEVMPLADFVRFLQFAAARLAQPALGRRAGRHPDYVNLGPLGRALAAAPTLGAALRVFCTAFAAVQSHSACELSIEGSNALLRYRILDPTIWPRDQDAEYTLSICIALIEQAGGEAARPDCIALEHPPQEAMSVSEAGWRCTVRHNALWNEIHFPSGLLDRGLPRGPVAEFSHHARTATSLAQAGRRRRTLAEQVRHEILFRLGRLSLGQSEVASAVGVSDRSLRRHLDAAGMSFTDLVAICRCEMAEHLLSHSQLPISAIAELTGYADARAFERAFRRRSGLTPSRFRRSNLGADRSPAASPLQGASPHAPA